MLFNSLTFFIFFSIVFSFYFLIPQRVKWLFLLISSYIYYGYPDYTKIIYLIIPTIIIYFITIKISEIEEQGKKRVFFVAAIIISISVLLYFKYTDFLLRTFYSLKSIFIHGSGYSPLGLIIPMGVSFYSFKLVSYSIDVYLGRMKPEKHFGYFALYVSFFPQILMGPIERAINFIPELKKKTTFDIERVISNLQLVVWGLFKKLVIADRLSFFINEVFGSPHYQGINLLFGAYFYAIQIYCDFSGYSDIAIGIAGMLGIKSMDNFNFPYFSKNMTDFWNRWHISLSTWLRDYLFLPIAYAVSRRLKSDRFLSIKSDYVIYASGMFITMFLGGLWHGAAWTFVIWGMLHGIFLIVGYSTKKAKKRLFRKLKVKKIKLVKDIVAIFVTFNLVSFAWVFFRSESFSKAVEYISLVSLNVPHHGSGHLFLNIIIVAVFLTMELIYKRMISKDVIKKIPLNVKTVVLALFICIVILFSVQGGNEFIYSRF